MKIREEARRLPESELDIMLPVWAAGERGTTAPEIGEALERPITASALHSYLKRLEEKGFLACVKQGKVNRYTALVSKEDYQAREGKSVLQKLYGSSLRRFTAALYDGGALSQADLDELRDFLNGLK